MPAARAETVAQEQRRAPSLPPPGIAPPDSTTAAATAAVAPGSSNDPTARSEQAPYSTFEPAGPDDGVDVPLSKDELFGVEKPQGNDGGTPARSVDFRGFIENETAYTFAAPAHWSTAIIRTQIAATGQFSERTKWKASLRMDIDPVYWLSDFYPTPVKDNQRFDLMVRETYIDTSAGNWEFRFGRQQIVWGEVVGLFFADVVSARDERDFILPSFEIIRIPQWAARAEYFAGDSHFEVIWIPYVSYDNIGQPGAEFYPLQVSPPPGFTQIILGEEQPAQNLSNTNYGARVSTLKRGWDLSAFYYSSEDRAPTFYRQVILGPTPTVLYQPRHDRIWQAGFTVGKDLGKMVFKTEAVYTDGRSYNVTRLSEPTGVVEQDTLDYVFSLDFALPRDVRLNLQLFQRIYFDHDPDLIADQFETGASVLLSGKLGQKWEPEILWIQGFNPWQSLIRPRMTWRPAANWRASFGVDIFNGPALSAFGRFSNRDRAYAELRYDF